MNLDELKTTWKTYDQRLQATQRINEKIIASMITNKSAERFSTVQKEYVAGFIWMTICLAFGLGILLGNPFDYQYSFQFVPTWIYSVCLTLLLLDTVRSYVALNQITFQDNSIDLSLKKVVAVYEKPKKIMNYILLIFLFTQVVLFPLSFLPKNIDKMGLWTALAERLIPITISGLLLWGAYKMGAFRQRHVQKFKQYQHELNTLREMTNELQTA